MAEFLLELLSEEIPAGMQERAAADLKRLVTDGLKDAGLAFDSARAFSGPRRLTLVVDGLPMQQPDRTEERKGPRADAPDKAIEGFLKSLGLTRDQVEERDTKKGKVLFAVTEEEGKATADVLGGIIFQILSTLTWPKSMRWPQMVPVTWVRPMRTLLAIFEGKPLGSKGVTFHDMPANDESLGHPVHAPDPFAVKDFADYEAKLRAGRVILDAEERKRLIRDGANELAKAEGLSVVEDEALVAENAGLVEWPVPLMGRIDEAFLELPPEVLRASMRTHQKYFALNDAAGNLAPRFIVIANIEAKDGGKAIVAGNERVLRARLADAKFFWDQDRKRTLASRAPQLADIVFHAKLGTVDQKADRVQALATEIATHIPGADKDRVRSAARLAKADLVTQMVVEFPGLQGVMGRYYALADGEHEDVARAIAEHYSPQGPNDACPASPVSVAVALADKIDTLFWFFAIDEKPTGSKDPFALRRAALGVIRLIFENGLRLPLTSIFEDASYNGPVALPRPSGARGGWAPVAADLLDFFAERLKVQFRDKGVRHDLISAVFAQSQNQLVEDGGPAEIDLARVLTRTEALGTFLGTDDGANLLVAYRRAANIVRIEEKKDRREFVRMANEDLLRQPEEVALNRALIDVETKSKRAIQSERFVEAMSVLSQLRQPVDKFFDEVTVNCDDAALRENRLGLLGRIPFVMDEIADFSQIEG